MLPAIDQRTCALPGEDECHGRNVKICLLRKLLSQTVHSLVFSIDQCTTRYIKDDAQ